MKEQNNPLDLNNLTMDDIDFSILPEIVAETEREEWEYKEKYGDDWWEHYVRETNPDFDIDSIEQIVNEIIYEGHYLCMNGSPELLMKIEHRYWKKMKQLFGPFCKRYINHPQNDPKVNKALLKDALKSRKWRELPKELQDEYHKLAREYPDTKDLDLNQLTEDDIDLPGLSKHLVAKPIRFCNDKPDERIYDGTFNDIVQQRPSSASAFIRRGTPCSHEDSGA